MKSCFKNPLEGKTLGVMYRDCFGKEGQIALFAKIMELEKKARKLSAVELMAFVEYVLREECRRSSDQLIRDVELLAIMNALICGENVMDLEDGEDTSLAFMDFSRSLLYEKISPEGYMAMLMLVLELFQFCGDRNDWLMFATLIIVNDWCYIHNLHMSYVVRYLMLEGMKTKYYNLITDAFMAMKDSAR